jgi:formyltetrahydrofolate deformylase
MQENREAVILVTCPDQRGIVAQLMATIHESGGNILDAAQHTSDTTNTFLQRIHVSWSEMTQDSLQSALNPIIKDLNLNLQIRWMYSSHKVAIFVSREDHCLHDLLLLQRDGALHCSISMVISNHPDLEVVAQRFGIPFHFIPVDDSSTAETKQLVLLKENDIDLVVLARYMQLLSPEFIDQFNEKIINIHHSFLPAFAGGKPYHQAHEKGVKLIGATAHYATAELDAGPIIEQGVIRVSHKDSVFEMIHKGRDIERTVLARAVRWHIENRIIVHHNRAVVFE